jgi:phosphatidate cytidylyltransferase
VSPGALALAWAIGLFGIGALAIAAYGLRDRTAAAALWPVYTSTAVIAAAVLVPIAIHPFAFSLVLAAGAYRCVAELAATYRVPVRGAWREALAAAALAAAFSGALRSPAATVALVAITVAAAAAVGPLYVRAFTTPPAGGPRAAVLAAAFPLLAAAHLSRIAYLPDGIAWIFVLYATAESQDSAAYLFGRLFGRRRLLPRLSPKKTVAGAAAGATCALIVGTAAASALLGLAARAALALAALIAVAAFCGDLYTSALKRGAGIKDFPAVHRLHGGVLDIYDSTLFAGLVSSIYIIGAWTY